MSDAYPVLTGETGTVNTGTNVVTLDDTTGVRDLRLFSAAVTAGSLADGDTVRVLIKESATKQAAWIATYDSTAKTLTRTTLIDAIGTLTNVAAVDVTVEPLEPGRVEALSYQSQSYKSGMLVTYNGGTPQLQVGKASVNGEVLHLASATTTVSGDALAADKQYYIYVYDNSGTVQMHREQRDSSSDDPVWDHELGYYKHPSDGAAKRLVGWYPTKQSSSAVLDFTATGKGRDLSIVINSTDNFNNRQVNGAASDSGWTAFSLGKYCPPVADMAWLTAKIAGDDAEDGIVSLSAHDLGSGVAASGSSHHWRLALARAGTTAYLGPAALSFDEVGASGLGRMWYRTQQLNGTTITYIEVHGARIIV